MSSFGLVEGIYLMVLSMGNEKNLKEKHYTN